MIFLLRDLFIQLGDTICAARAGIVFECNDNVKEGEAKNLTYKSTRNRIRVAHQDGSIGAFEILAPIQLLVQSGDKIIPGTPLAVFNKESEKYIVLLSLYYLNEKKLMTENAGVDIAPSNYSYLHAHFYSAESNSAGAVELDKKYIVAHPKEIVAAEMTKREKKKLVL